MKYSINRGDEPQEVKKITILIGDDKFRITETIDGKLEINKSSLYDRQIFILPRVSNVIEID